MLSVKALIATLFAFSTSIRAMPLDSAAQTLQLLSRANPVCGGQSNLTQCGANFPSEFCCPTGTTCYGFNGNQSVICCPQDQCTFINTLSCDPTVYNATAYPSSPIHMEDLSPSAYTQCSGTNQCCPKGYSCVGGGCQLISTTTIATSSLLGGSSQTSSTSSSTPTSMLSLSSAPIQPTNPVANSVASSAATTSSTSTSGATAAAATNSSPPQTTSSGPQFPIEAILVGLLPGLAAGCLLAFLLMCCFGRRKSRNLTSDSSSSLGPTVAKISDPIYTVDPSATRTDFLRHASRRIARKASRPLLGSTTNSSSSPSAESSISRVRSLFRKTPTTGSIRSGSNTLWGNTPNQHESSMPDPSSAAERALDARLGRMNTTSTTGGPRTPRREPSMESIPIYNNTPDAGGFDRNTVFADLLPALSMHDVSDTVPRLHSPPARQESTGLMPPIYLGSPEERRPGRGVGNRRVL